MISIHIKASYFLYSINTENIYNFLLYFFIPLIVFFVILIIFSLYVRYSEDKNLGFRENIENETNTFLTELIFSGYTAPQIKNKIAAKVCVSCKKMVVCPSPKHTHKPESKSNFKNPEIQS